MSRTYLVWRPYQGETEDDSIEIEADSPQEAAEEWALLDDMMGCADIAEGGLAVIWVRHGTDLTRWLVRGGDEPVYTAITKLRTEIVSLRTENARLKANEAAREGVLVRRVDQLRRTERLLDTVLDDIPLVGEE